MQNKVVAIGLFATVAIALIIASLEEVMSPELVNILYTLDGLGYFVFAIWGGILLLKK